MQKKKWAVWDANRDLCNIQHLVKACRHVQEKGDNGFKKKVWTQLVGNFNTKFEITPIDYSQKSHRPTRSGSSRQEKLKGINPDHINFWTRSLDLKDRHGLLVSLVPEGQ